MIVAGDRVTAALRFTGHFTGTLGEHQGQGQAIDFIAMDIYRIADGRIAEDWHLEDNLAFMRRRAWWGVEPCDQLNPRGGLTGASSWAKVQRAMSSLRMKATPAWLRA